MSTQVRGIELKVLRIIKSYETGISKAELRTLTSTELSISIKVINSLLFRGLIDEKEGILYAK